MLCATQAIAAPVVRGCESDFDWPPLSYQTLDANGQASWHGLGYVLAETAFSSMGYSLQVSRMPWARCLAEAAAGRFDVLLLSSYSPERERDFLYSAPLVSTTLGLFHLRNRHLPERFYDAKALGRFRLCAVNSANLSAFQVEPGRVDFSAFDLDAVVAKIVSGRCDYAPVVIEVFQATLFRDGLNYGADPRFGFSKADWVGKVDYMTLFPRNLPSSAALRDRYNAALKQLHEQGIYDRLAEQYHWPH
ncbi:substrate-binding periplasmic protein [Chitinimonas sp.]|uniref:substrate-binding periplasmic protein n=1 Tax=Chitinimonas sp. TaxID=1934313 RepID=UPI0035AE9795